MGAQAIAIAFGLELFNLKKIMHGKQSTISILDPIDKLYRGLENKIIVGRYHSWAIKMHNNDEFFVSAVDQEDVVMSFRHKIYPLTGIQYHPESILTMHGEEILKNWLKD